MPDDPPKTARSEGYRHDPTAFPSLPQAGPRYGWQLPSKPPNLCGAAVDATVSFSEFRRVSRTQSTENLITRAYDGQICVCTQLKARRLVCPGVNGWFVLCASVESSKHQWMGCVRCRNPCRVLSTTHIPYVYPICPVTMSHFTPRGLISDIRHAHRRPVRPGLLKLNVTFCASIFLHLHQGRRDRLIWQERWGRDDR